MTDAASPSGGPRSSLSRAGGQSASPGLAPAFRRAKYRNTRVVVEGKSFASALEGRVYAELRLLERAGKVNSIIPQFTLTLHTTDMKGVKHAVGHHRIDFRYWDCEKKEFAYIECKGMDVAMGKWKRRHAEKEYGIVIELRRK